MRSRSYNLSYASFTMPSQVVKDDGELLHKETGRQRESPIEKEVGEAFLSLIIFTLTFFPWAVFFPITRSSCRTVCVCMGAAGGVIPRAYLTRWWNRKHNILVLITSRLSGFCYGASFYCIATLLCSIVYFFSVIISFLLFLGSSTFHLFPSSFVFLFHVFFPFIVPFFPF